MGVGKKAFYNFFQLRMYQKPGKQGTVEMIIYWRKKIFLEVDRKANIQQANPWSSVIIIFLYAITIKNKANLYVFFLLPVFQVSLKMYFTYLKVSHYKSKQIKLFSITVIPEVSSGAFYYTITIFPSKPPAHLCSCFCDMFSQILSHVLHILFVLMRENRW